MYQNIKEIMFTDNPQYIPESKPYDIEVYESYYKDFFYVKLVLKDAAKNIDIVRAFYHRFYYEDINVVIFYNYLPSFSIDDAYIRNNDFYICFYIPNDFGKPNALSNFLTTRNLNIVFVKYANRIRIEESEKCSVTTNDN